VYDIRALKTGMLADPAAIEVIADRISRHPEVAKVIDPVMVATSGARLVSPETVAAVAARLVPLATLLTPNLPEAECLAGAPGSPRELAKRIFDAHGCAVLVKGGHGSGEEAVDVLYDGREYSEFSMPWVANPVSTHGTGCSLAAALAAELALGRPLADAVRGAKAYVHDAIERSHLVGVPGCGVLGFAPRREGAERTEGAE
jgi:hydroxymethylpyrimidine/phosphomethylpyrimidine kinase